MHPLGSSYKLRTVLIGTGLAALLGLPGARGIARAAPRPEAGRIVHRFDFDERKDGNLEDLPKYWAAVRPRGFPRFATGTFDFEVGRDAPPSFHLSSEGRNVAFHYAGPETRVRAKSEYGIEGYIRADKLVHARACISAHFLGSDGKPLAGSLVRSRYIGGADESDGWHKVELHLPAAPIEARTIGIIAWVMQEPTWNTKVPLRRHIPRLDVYGGAWFDDITINALPHVDVRTSASGNVLAPGEQRELRVTLSDAEDVGLVGRLSITDAGGNLVETHQIAAATGKHAGAVGIPVDQLRPGLYEARLTVLDGAETVSSRKITFAQLAPRFRTGGRARPFGVVVEPAERGESADELALLRHSAIQAVKLPVWSGLPDDPPTPRERRDADRLLQALVKDGFALTGVFFGPPRAIVRADGPYPRPLTELLAGPPSVWKEHLASVVAPYASVFNWWQMGRDGDPALGDDDELERAASQLADAMRKLVTTPLLAVPATITAEPSANKTPAQQLALTISAETPPGWVRKHVRKFDALGYAHVSAFVEPLPARQYRRLPRLANWAQRVLIARHSGVDPVFVPQTWSIRESGGAKITEPLEEYLLLRTIADVISNAVPGGRIPVRTSIYCLAFDEGDSTTLAIWDAAAPPEGSRLVIQLGQAERQIDLWGTATALESDEQGRQILRLSRMPVLIDGVDRALMELRNSVTLSPDRVESGTELVNHTLEITNRGSKGFSGEVTLEAPKDWEITPRTLSFSLMPQRSTRLDLQIRYPHNEPAGSKSIMAAFTLTDPRYYLELPLPLTLGLKDIEVRGMAIIEGDYLILRHIVSNRTGDVLHFRGAADVPGRERQYRPFSALRPGDTQTMEYRFSSARDLQGAKVRIGLREMNDGPRTHTLELIVP